MKPGLHRAPARWKPGSRPRARGQGLAL